MLLDMENHSTLLSLNMSPFQATSGDSPNNPSAASPMPPPPPHQYQSPPNNNNNNNNNYSCHQQQQQQLNSDMNQQYQMQQQQQIMQNYSLNTLDTSYLFSSAGLMEMGVGGNSNASYIHLSGVGGGSSGVATTSIMPDALPDTKDLIEELCPVCGDKVSGYHYGLLTCESCKGFFKRTVQNKKVYTCVAERSCHIDKTQRKRCPFCRFQKCLDVGMKLEAVRADRMRGGRNKFGPMYKRDRARKLQLMRQRQLAAQTLRASGMLPDGAIYTPTTSTGCGGGGGGVGSGVSVTTNGPPGASSFASVHIKQEIQIPQVSSLTSSPDSSPSPISAVLSGGHAASLHTSNHHSNHHHSNHHHHHHHHNNNNNTSSTGSGGGHSNAASAASNPIHIVPTALTNSSQLLMTTTTSSSTTTTTTTTSSSWTAQAQQANSTTTSPHSLSPKAFQFEAAAASCSAAGGKVVVSPLIRDFVSAIDDREWQNSLYGLLQSQTYNQCEVDLFELMCKVLDQNLFSQVDWARNSVFFKDLKVDDQMKLLQHSWSDMLVLDHMHQRMHNSLPDETTLHNGQKFDLLNLGLLGVPSLADHFNDITAKLQELKFDVSDYICIKFLLLLNPDVRGISNRKFVHEGYEQVQQALLQYTITCYQNIQDKFNKMLQLLPDIHSLATRGEEHLYMKHCNGGAPTQTLLMEMLHAKRK